MKELLNIRINEGGVFVDCQRELESENTDFKSFSALLYERYDLSYPKFFKMDELCKLGILGAHILFSKLAEKEYSQDTAVILSTKTGCLYSDLRHYKSIQNSEKYFPSPAEFVYTLPNIVVGEICIKHNLLGESTCFITETPEDEMVKSYIENLFIAEKTTYCLVGWLDFRESSYNCQFSLIKKN